MHPMLCNKVSFKNPSISVFIVLTFTIDFSENIYEEFLFRPSTGNGPIRIGIHAIVRPETDDVRRFGSDLFRIPSTEEYHVVV